MSNFKKGDRVETNISWAEPIPAGTVGTLDQMYRIQDGAEIWPLWLDRSRGLKRLVAVAHTQIRKVVG